MFVGGLPYGVDELLELNPGPGYVLFVEVGLCYVDVLFDGNVLYC